MITSSFVIKKKNAHTFEPHIQPPMRDNEQLEKFIQIHGIQSFSNLIIHVRTKIHKLTALDAD